MVDRGASADPSLLQSLKNHLEGLKRTEHGLVLYNHIQRGLQNYADKDGRIELVFVSFLHALLGKYATNPVCDPATRVKARLIQQRLTAYLPNKPVTASVPPLHIEPPKLHEPAPAPVTAPPPQTAAVPVNQDQQMPDAEDARLFHARRKIRESPSPPAAESVPAPQAKTTTKEKIIRPPTTWERPAPISPRPVEQPALPETPAPPRVEPKPAPVADVAPPDEVNRLSAAADTPPPITPMPIEQSARQQPPAPSEPTTPAAFAPTDQAISPMTATEMPATPMAAEPVVRQEKIESPEATFVEPAVESIAVDEQFGELLEKERVTIENMESPLGEFNDMKQILVKGLNELIEERQALIEKLSSAGDYLKAVESDRERRRQELGKARQNGTTDELTGLPNREVFVKQLESEIGRVKRYGFSLALAVVDIDNLEAVNKRYGRSAGDAVLRCYAGEILAKFRTYDLVARYGEDSFSVLFPNTQKDGAMHALEKARKTATSTFIHHEGKNIPLPSFSSVLTQHAAGEPAASLLKRADETLIQAKAGGFNRMVVALPTS